jgi:type I restriction-modification system DNA methylase subunit
VQLENVLERLGYSQSDNYKRAVEETPQTTHLFRGLKKTQQINGCYTFHTSRDDQILPIRAAVYVAEANTEDEARQIHKELWNFSNAPFLIVVLPHQIRVYTGFDYSANDETKGEIRSPIENLAEISQVLTSFFADSIDFAKIWKSEAEYLDPNKRVDSRLLKNLETLEKYLVKQGLQRPIAQALIGKYIYIKYLRERGILSDPWLSESNIDLDYVLGRDATVTELEKLVDKLEERFQGNVFPLDFKDIPSDSAKSISIVASIFHGDEIQDRNTDEVLIQLHLDFKAYDFSYIPIETLSAIYEQFLHAQDKGKKDGAIYTPEPVADYLICEMNSVKPLELEMKILDPCCGSGIFLVLVYRKLIEKALIEKELENGDNKLEPFELKNILVSSIYGVERNPEACYLTEFSLLLMMLNYIEPPELHKNKDFKFPSLHNQNIFVCDFFENQSVFWQLNKSFDWIIGNPPWKEIKPKDTEEDFARDWIKDNLKDRPATGNRISEAFTWRVIDLLDADGLVGFVTPAMSLFNHESEKYRQKFFVAAKIFRVTNFTNMRQVLFSRRAVAPSVTLIYAKTDTNENKPDILHYAPFVVNQVSNNAFINHNKIKEEKKITWSITINENEIQSVSYNEIEQGLAEIWKIALWGNYRDKKVIEYIKRLFPLTLGCLEEENSWHLHQGIQLREIPTDEKLYHKPELQGKMILDAKKMSKSGYRFSFPQIALNKVITEKNCYIRKQSGDVGINIVKAPHFVINPNYCAYSDQDFVIPHSQIGMSVTWDDSRHLQAISVLINSSIIQYYLFFCSPSWGTERDKVYLEDVKKIPIPNLSQKQIDDLAILQEHLVSEELFGNKNNLQEILDSEVNHILKIPDTLRIVCKEFMEIRLTLNQGKTKTIATEPPSIQEDLLNYAERLRYELDNFVEGSDIRHSISITTSKDLIICTVELYNSETEIPIKIKKADAQDAQFLREIQQKLRQQFSQWVYIQRGMRLFSDTQIHICKNPRLIDWTQTQAMYDSDNLIAEMLNRRKS